MYYGTNIYTLCLTEKDVVDKINQGEYGEALNLAFTTMAYMLVPTMFASINPYIGIGYTLAMTSYSGCKTIANIYSLYQEYIDNEYELKSITAWKDFYSSLSKSSLQLIYDFSGDVQRSEIKINDIKHQLEKTDIKHKLTIEGEFGNKLYNMIFIPYLEEKYEILNKVVKGTYTKEEATDLEPKHIKITTKEKDYDGCVEVKNNSNEKYHYHINEEQYHCYSLKQKILDHVIIIGDNLLDIKPVEF